jgi:hypothetical protein
MSEPAAGVQEAKIRSMAMTEVVEATQDLPVLQVPVAVAVLRQLLPTLEERW